MKFQFKLYIISIILLFNSYTSEKTNTIQSITNTQNITINHNNSFDLANKTNEKEIKPFISYFNQRNYESPILYIQKSGLFISKREQKITTGKSNGNFKEMISFNSIDFQMNPTIDSKKIRINYLNNSSEFCKKIKFNITKNKIYILNEFEKLKTITKCVFKIELDDFPVELNQFVLYFNYTVKDWASSLGNGTEAQKTAHKILSKNINTDETEINLNKSKIKDLSPLVSFNQLKILNLEENDVDEIDHSIQYLKDLQILNLSKNEITTFPRNIKSLNNLACINLSKNKITEFEINENELLNLQELNLSFNNLNKIPSSIKNLKNIQEIDLSVNKIENISKSITKLLNLNTLNLDHNKISNVDLDLTKLKNLKKLSLEGNKINKIPEYISKIKSLEYLDISSNRIKEFPLELTKLCNLYYIDISFNNIEYIPNSIDNLSNLDFFIAEGNSINKFPESLLKFEDITLINLEHNKIKNINNEVYKKIMSNSNILLKNNSGYPDFGNPKENESALNRESIDEV